MRDTWSHRLLLFAIFLLPWQTRWIFSVALIGGEPSEYGQLSLYATEALIALALLLRGRPMLLPRVGFVIQGGYFLLGVAFISLGLSSFFSVGLAQVLHLSFAFALLNLLLDVRTNVRAVAVAFVSGLILPSLLGWWQVITGASPSSTWLGLAGKQAASAGVAVVETASGRMLRAYGTLPHPNIFGGFLAVGLLLMAWLVRFIRDRRAHVLSGVLVVFLSATLIITFSRSAWLGIAIGFLVLIGLIVRRRRLPPSRALPMIALGLLSVLATLGVFYEQVFSRTLLVGRLENLSVVERSSQYARFDDVFLMNPLVGVGPGAYPFAMTQIDQDAKAWAYQPIHNAFLLVLGELGALGLIALLCVLWRADQLNAKTAQTAGGMIGLALGIAMIVIALFDHYLFSLWPGMALGVLAIALPITWPFSVSASPKGEAPSQDAPVPHLDPS